MQFESFNERLQKINHLSVNYIKHTLDADDRGENLSFFAIALEKWQDLNCTQDYKNVRQKIGSFIDVQSLMQIIHRKDELSNIIIEELKIKETKALDAILELIVALARDLQSEFYEYFPVIFELLVDLTCEATEAETIEALFVCQTFLFKYLSKFILKDIGKYFEVIKRKALTSKKEYVLNFSCEVFSFLIKKSKHQDDLVQMLFDSLKTDSNISKGIGRILFECIRGVNHAFYSKSKSFLDIIFTKYTNLRSNVSDEMMHYFLEYLLEFSTLESFSLIWNFLLLEEQKFSPKIVPLLHQAIEFKKCKLVHNSSLILNSLNSYLSIQKLDLHHKLIILDSLKCIFIYRSNELSLENVDNFCDNFFISNSSLPLDEIFTFSQNVINSSLFDVVINKYCCKLCFSLMSSKNEEIFIKCLEFLAYIVINKRSKFFYGNEVGQISKYLLKFNDENQIEEILLDFIKNSSDITALLFCVIVSSNLSSSYFANQFCEEINKIFGKTESLIQPYQSNHGQIIGLLMLESIVSLILWKSHKCVINEIDSEHIIAMIK